MKQVNKLNPFGRFCCTIGNLPTSYMESLTYEQQLMWFCKYLEEKVVPAINENADAIIELQEYLKNLDLQDEVNNKLDEMAEDGTLAEIINQDIFNGILTDIDDLQIAISGIMSRLNTTDGNVRDNTNRITSLENTKADASDLENFEYITTRDINTLSSRVDSIATLPEGSTTGDAELIDGRTGWQGQKFVSIGQAIRDQFTNYDNQIDSIIASERSINLFNKFDVINGYSLGVDGNPTPNSSAYVSNYISVEPGDVLVPTSHVTRCYYDASKTFVERRTSSSTNETVPAGAYYVRFVTTSSDNNTNNINRFVVYKSDGVTTTSKTNIPFYSVNALNSWQGQKYLELGDAIQTQLKALFDETKNYVVRERTINLFNKYDMLLNKNLRTFGNIVDSTVYHISNFIEVNPGDVLVASAATYRAYYDANKNFVELKQAADGNTDTIPADVKYVRYDIWQAPGQNTSVDSMVVYKSTGPDDLTPKTGIPYYKYSLKDVSKTNLAKIFKKVVCCGDSYTSGYIDTRDGSEGDYNPQCEDFAYPAFMSKLTGNEWLNAGKSGANVLTWQSDPLGLARAQSYGKAQAYVIGLMINDSSSGPNHVNLGTYADIGTSAETYYGGYSKIIERLLLINPDAIILACTCPNDETRFDDYNQAVREIVNYYRSTNTNVHCLDLRANIDLYKNNPTLQGDFIHSHYTAIGYEMFSELLNDILSSYINNHIDEFQNVAFIDYE